MIKGIIYSESDSKSMISGYGDQVAISSSLLPQSSSSSSSLTLGGGGGGAPILVGEVGDVERRVEAKPVA